MPNDLLDARNDATCDQLDHKALLLTGPRDVMKKLPRIKHASFVAATATLLLTFAVLTGRSLYAGEKGRVTGVFLNVSDSPIRGILNSGGGEIKFGLEPGATAHEVVDTSSEISVTLTNVSEPSARRLPVHLSPANYDRSRRSYYFSIAPGHIRAVRPRIGRRW